MIFGALILLAALGASVVVSYYDEGIAEDCDDTVGTIGQAVGADEGQCQDAEEQRDTLDSLVFPLNILGASLVILPLIHSLMGRGKS
ncbi:MAG: hypothetical protein CMB53_05000 [Euryarchaeota archaeon]|nr:hypothetical protein [Euryarchaeota archaeon]